MWILIIVALITGFCIFKYYDRDIITVSQRKQNLYLLEFESGKQPLCELVEIYRYKEKNYYVFIPCESLKAVEDADIIILKPYSENNGKMKCFFANKEADEIIFQHIKHKYKCKYNFIG